VTDILSWGGWEDGRISHLIVLDFLWELTGLGHDELVDDVVDTGRGRLLECFGVCCTNTIKAICFEVGDPCRPGRVAKRLSGLPRYRVLLIHGQTDRVHLGSVTSLGFNPPRQQEVVHVEHTSQLHHVERRQGQGDEFITLGRGHGS